MRENILIGTLGIAGFFSVSMPTTEAQSNQSSKPNVLMIILDDAGYNDFGFMGCKDIPTPNIDKLASTGTVFSDGHVSASVSGPSRAGILTGRYQQRNGYECNLEDVLGLGLEEETAADIFKRNGYTTYCIGKWHQGAADEYHPNKRGFEHFYGFIAGSRSYFYRPTADDREGNEKVLQYNGRKVPFSKYLTTELSDKAVDFIAKQPEGKPFMMYLSFNAVHTPMEATAEDMALFKGYKRQKLAAMTFAVDRAIGSVINKLSEKGIMENTLIFFLSDNGGAHNNTSSNYPLKGFKGNKFEGGIRVPFFVKFGDRFEGKFEGIVSSLDILPTAMSVAGIPINSTKKHLDGVDLIPYLQEKVKGNPHEKLFWRKEEMAAMRMGDYKLIRVAGVGERLYNLKKNLNETEDVKSTQPLIFKKMMDELKQWETGLINPPLWNEGKWTEVTREIHRDLMNNRPVQKYSPDNYSF
ncbi:MAG: sulfatase-like hydrolase/transferase [Paludibacter sp.]|nr:sulfatase-like hydrolase/transferase [Paludibacter sp.]